MSSKSELIIPKIKKETILSLLRKDKRIDDRGLDDYREIEITTNLIGKADGSAIVKLGDTTVITGVKVQLDRPFPDTPEKGIQIVNAELIPLASPIFEPGPPGEEDVELSRVIDRGLRSSEMIKLDELVLIPGEKVWAVFVDIYALDHGGNLIDASALASVAALLTTQYNKVEVEDDNIIVTDEKINLPIGNIPVFVTIAKIGDKLIVDPSYEEELVMDARITFVIDENESITGIQKGNPGVFTYGEIMEAKNIAIRVSKKLREKLASITKDL